MLAEKEEELRKSLKNVLLAAVMIIMNFSGISENSALAENCKEAEIIFARGSGQKLGDNDARAFSKVLDEQLSRNGVEYHFYELGEEEQVGIKYPAVGIGMLEAIGIVVSRGEAEKFGKSVEDGAAELVNYVRQLGKKCPMTKVILAGYSQGAKVIEKALPKMLDVKIQLVLTFGDPKLFLPEGAGVNPPACQGQGLSSYREFAPDCKTDKGILGARDPYELSPAIGKFKIWCNEGDLICGARANFANLMGGHTSYAKGRRYDNAAKVILKTLRSTAEITGESSEPLVQNTAIVIDSTGSMFSKIERYKYEAMRLAEKSLAGGGKIALFEYKDILADKFKTKMWCDFSCSLEEFKEKLKNIRTGGGGDTPESALPAMMDALEKLEWQQGANKSIVLLTDAGYFNPSQTGIRTDHVLRRSLEIDPVNIYVVAPQALRETYREIVEGSGGKFFAIENAAEVQLSTEYLLGRPLAMMPLAEYRARPGETVWFDASKSMTEGGIAEFSWDLDGDGKFEIVDSGSVVQMVYEAPRTGFVQVKVKDKRGFESTMSARLVIREPEKLARIKEMTAENKENIVIVRFQAEHAEKVILVIDDVVMGVVEGDRLEIEELGQKDLRVRLVPFGKDGARGEARELRMKFDKENGKYVVDESSELSEAKIKTGNNNGSKGDNKVTKNGNAAEGVENGERKKVEKGFEVSNDGAKIPVPMVGGEAEREKAEELRVPDTGVVASDDDWQGASDRHIHICKL